MKLEADQIQYLVKARELLAKGWCAGTYARTVEDIPCDLFSNNAAKFCAMGALYRTLEGPTPKTLTLPAELALNAASLKLFGRGSIMGLNDSGGAYLVPPESTNQQTKVLAVYDYVIEHEGVEDAAQSHAN